jgi:tungstate transport system ATP-binding protein
MSNPVALSLHDVSYSHEKGKALEQTTLEISKNKTTVILGPNGAGKSILLKICHGLLEPTSGTIKLNENMSKSAMVFPKPVLLRRTVLQNMTFILELTGVDKSEQDDIAKTALANFSMQSLIDRPARSLSSGEKQRLSLVRALLLKPDILFLDEPTANLDPKATAILEDMIGLTRQNEMTIVMASHDLMQARRIAEEVIYIQDGTVIEKSFATEFFHSPKTEQAKKFIEGRL